MTTPQLPVVSYTARDFATIKAELLAFISSTNPAAWTDFSQSNLGVVLVELAALVGDVVSFGQDQVAQEIFLSTCRRYDSALRFANSVGYTPYGATAALATMTSQGALPASLVSNGGTIAALTSIKGLNGLNYEVQEAVTVPVGATLIQFNVLEGTTYNDTFDPSAQPGQVVTTANYVVQNDSWTVYVGTVSPSNAWTQVDNVANETGATNTYSVTLNSLGQLVVTFGDGDAGAIPADTITINYRTCDGEAGNCPAGGIIGSVSVALQSPATGTVSVSFENINVSGAPTSGTALVSGENQGNTVNSTTQTATCANVPLVTGTLVVTIVLPASGGTIVLQDNGAGAFVVSTNTSSFTLSSSAITYTTGVWTAHFNAALPASGSITGAYYAIATSSASAAVTGAASGGADRETLAQLQTNIPAYIRSQGKIITISDYVDNLSQIPGVALSFVENFVSSYTANMVRISAWGSAVVGFQSEDSDGDLDPPQDYAAYTQIPPSQVSTIQAYLTPITMLTVGNVILQPTMTWVDVYLGTVNYDQRVPAATVRAAICAAVIGVFESSSGFSIRLADIWNAVRQAAGVLYFAIQRTAIGTQATSTEAQGMTTASTTVSGTLANPTVQPGSVSITINQTSSLTVTIGDNSAGAFTVTGGTLVLASSSINYATGAWTATFTTTLIASQTVLASYANVTDDYRQAQVVTIGSSTNGDSWPPVGVTETIPVTTPPFQDGVPLSALRPSSGAMAVSGITRVFATGMVTATVTTTPAHGYSTGCTVYISGASPSAYDGSFVIVVTGAHTFTYTFAAASDPGAVTGSSISALLQNAVYPYAIGDVLTYARLIDIVIAATQSSLNRYNSAYLFNNEIYYDSIYDATSDVTAINLRRLVFDLAAT